MDENIIIVLIVAGIVIGVLMLGWIPGHIAKSRGHINADAINIAGWLGIFFAGILWLVALIWAYTGPDNCKRSATRNQPSPRVSTRRHRRRPVTAAADALDDLSRS